MPVEPINFECCACHARIDRDLDGEQATLVLLLAMLRDGLSARDFYNGLCFAHRRRLDALLGDWQSNDRA